MPVGAQRIALVHDWLVTFAGSERVLAALLDVFPSADLFAVVDHLSDEDRSHLAGKRARTTFLQHWPQSKTRYRTYLPFMPLAIEQLDLTAYDIVISSSHAVAKGVLTGPDQLHISYVHSPMRYAWDLQHQYLREAGIGYGVRGWMIRSQLHRLRQWDFASGQRPDVLLANSEFISRRIRKAYRRDAQVLHPPVDVDDFSFESTKGEHYLTASRLVPYKRIDLIVQAFASMPDRQLVVVGDGPDRAKIASMAGNNVTMLGHVPRDRLKELMQQARAFVFAAEEDFGIVPVEAQACGTPVIAFGRGGARETVIEDGPTPTGVFFARQTVDDVVAAVDRFESQRDAYDPIHARANAQQFSARRFREEARRIVDDAWDQHVRGVR